MWIEINDENHWKELRSKNVGGSDIGSLFGCGYLTEFELWHQKNGTLAPEDFGGNERVLCGTLFESAIAEMVRRRGFLVEETKHYVTCDDTPGMACTPDRIIRMNGTEEKRFQHPSFAGIGTDKPGLLQIKNTDYFEFKKWEDGEPPMKYQLQLQHELACTGYSWGALGIFVGGNRLELFPYLQHERAIEKIKFAVTEFWQSIEEGREPRITEGDDYSAATKVYPLFDMAIDLSGDNEIPMLCEEVRDASAIRLAAEKREKAAKAQILQKLGGASGAVCGPIFIENKTILRKAYEVAESSYQRLSIKGA